MTSADYARARRLLLRRDPTLAALIRQHGPCGLADALRTDHFSALVRAIVFQQLSTKAASTIHARLMTLIPEGAPSPLGLARITDDELRRAGISRQKGMYLRDLAARVAAGDVQLDGIEAFDDEAVIAALTRVKGIGRWTAEMFLMFRLQRPDVLPVGDLGILTAVQRAYGLRKKPTPERLRALAEPWKPYRSVACWYLWRSLDSSGDRVVAQTPTPASTTRARHSKGSRR